MTKSPDEKQKKGKKIIGVALSAILAGGLVVALGFFCWHQFSPLSQSNGQVALDEQAVANAADLIAKISQFMELPAETAAVATVQDITKLGGQEFFAQAQNGDKVLIFTEAKKALIYRESTNKIINYGPVVINSGATSE